MRRAIDELELLSYSEHLAWTKVPGIDLANLLPVPKTHAAADMPAPRIERLQNLLPVPLALENISYVVDVPEAEMGTPPSSICCTRKPVSNCFLT